MKRKRIEFRHSGNLISRVPFDLTEEWVKEHWRQEAWVRYRRGRLFVSRDSVPIHPRKVAHRWGPWVPIRFEPERGNARLISKQ